MRMKKWTLSSLFALALGVSAPAAMADTWAFNGDEAVIEKLAAEKQAQERLAVETVEVYDNACNGWAWDAAADKPRVYGRVHETYAFH